MARQGGLAEEVRVRLDSSSASHIGTMDTSPAAQKHSRAGRLVTLQALPGGKDKDAGSVSSVLDLIEHGKPVRRHIHEFGAVFAILFLIIGGVQGYKHGRLDLLAGWAVAALVFAGMAYTLPRVLYPLWKAWMKFAHVLGMVMTSVILFAAWVVMMIPLGLLLKVIGKKVMEVGFRNPQVPSYWEDKKIETTDFKLLERQF